MPRTSVDVEAAIDIARPRAEVWAVLADADRLPDWLGDFQAAECVGEQRSGVGTTVRFELSSGLVTTMEFLEWVDGERLVFEGAPQPLPLPGGRLIPHGAHELSDAAGGGTRLVSHYRPELTGTAVVARPYVSSWLRKHRQRDAERLKELVEAGP